MHGNHPEVVGTIENARETLTKLFEMVAAALVHAATMRG
jgi:hypothetical protein